MVRSPVGLSDYYKCGMGTRQGRVLITKLFLIFLNELTFYLEENGGEGIFIKADFPNICIATCYILLYNYKGK